MMLSFTLRDISFFQILIVKSALEHINITTATKVCLTHKR